MKGDHQYGGRPSGSSVGGYARARTQIGFDEETRKRIAKEAKKNNRSFGAEVRVLIAEALAARVT